MLNIKYHAVEVPTLGKIMGKEMEKVCGKYNIFPKCYHDFSQCRTRSSLASLLKTSIFKLYVNFACIGLERVVLCIKLR